MKKSNFRLFLLLILFAISVLSVPMTFSKYYVTYTRSVTLNISKPTYNIVFHSNTTNDQTITQSFTYDTPQNLDSNTFTNGQKLFLEWNTSADGSGTSYQDGVQVLNLTDVNGDSIDLYAQWSSAVAEINGVTYPTIKDALADVPLDDNPVTINILDNVSLSSTQKISILNHQNVILNLNGHTISNERGANIPLVDNAGTIRITNGTMHSTASQGVINNEHSTGQLYLDNCTISATGSKQAIYITAGYVEINDGAVLSSTSTNRVTVQNQGSGVLKINGGTITSTGFSAVSNAATMTIGTFDGVVSKTNPAIIGKDYGILATADFDLYDGRISGKLGAIDDETHIDDIETYYELARKTETINGESYHSLHLALTTYKVYFDPNGGTVSETDRDVETGDTVGVLPIPQYTGYVFDGWFDDDGDGHMITSSEIINGTITFYAHWHVLPKAIRVGSVEYEEFLDGWAAIPSNAQTNVTLLRNVTIDQKLTIDNSKDIIFDLNGNTLEYAGGTVFENSGTLEVKDTSQSASGLLTGGNVINNIQNTVIKNLSGGTVTISSGNISSSTSQVIDNSGNMIITGGHISIGDFSQGVLNNNAGATLTMSGGTIEALIAGSRRQSIYNKGTVYISGTATLTSASSDRATLQNDASGAKIYISGGTINSTNTSCQRGAVQNVSGATVEITGGTITSKSTNSAAGAVQNAGTLIVGNKDGIVDSTTPVLIGDKYGVNNSGTFKFYDGILKGISNAVQGSVTEYEDNSIVINGTEIIGSNTYITRTQEIN